MTKNRNSILIANSSKIWWILAGGSLITLYFNSKLQDPFNSPKMWILFLISSWLVGHIIVDSKKLFHDKTFLFFTLIIFLFLVTLLISALLTDLRFTAFFGENQRRNGFLTYLALAVFMIASAGYIRLGHFSRIRNISILLGFILAFYGLLQISGIDFVSWNNPYNSVISTVGNPNFAAAIMAIHAVMIITLVFAIGVKPWLRIMSTAIFVFIIYVIYLSEARQGLISLFIGLVFFINVFIFTKNKLLGYLSSIATLIIATVGLFGMLQIGPLTSLLYKGSVTVRGYYWRAGFEMFQQNIITGVGVDRYGAYFKEFRESTYPLNYGFTLTSSNAHNLPIQIFSTAGIFAGLAYISLISFIFWLGIRKILRSSGNEKIMVAGVFSAWLAYQAQSIISIDNIGISIWGWILGGVIVGLSRSTQSELEPRTKDLKTRSTVTRVNELNLFQPLLSTAILLVAIVIIIPLYRAETNMFQERMRFDPSNQANTEPMLEYANKIFNGSLVEPNYKLTSITYLFSVGLNSQAILELEKLVRADSRNQDALTLLARYYEATSELSKANEYRKVIYELDPWNSDNFLKMGRNYKVLGQFDSMDESLRKILAFDQVSVESKLARQELIR
jgi:O-antigen ligase